MKLVKGHMYLRGPSGEVVAYSEGIAKASGYIPFTQDEDFVNDMQLPENIKPVAGKRPMRAPVAHKQEAVTDQQKIKQLQAEVLRLQQKDTTTAVSQPAKAQVAAKPAAKIAAPQIKKPFPDGHMDITADMAADLSGLE